jgi:hypothetical protein
VLPLAGQTVPRAWDDSAVEGHELPLAVPERSPRYLKSAEYYRLPVVKVWKSYPMYRPDKEPAGYMEWLKQQEPQESQLFKAEMSEADWIAAGEIIFDMPTTYTAFDPATNHYHLKTFYDDLHIPTDPSGIAPYRRYFIRTKGKIEYGIAHCGMCHTQVLPNGTVVKGGQSSLPLERGSAWIGSRGRGDRADRQMQIMEQAYAIPWIMPVSQSRPKSYDEFLAISWATPPYVLGRGGGLLYAPFKVPDLIGIRDRKYLDATGLARHRDIADLMRYAIVNQTLQMHAWFGDYQPSPPPSDLSRYSDEQLYALAKFLYSLEPPQNPNAPNNLSRRGKEIFDREGCGTCHTPVIPLPSIHRTSSRPPRVFIFRPSTQKNMTSYPSVSGQIPRSRFCPAAAPGTTRYLASKAFGAVPDSVTAAGASHWRTGLTPIVYGTTILRQAFTWALAQ